MFAILFATLIAFTGFSSVLGQLVSVRPQQDSGFQYEESEFSFTCRGRKEGLYTNPFDCGGFYQCAAGFSSPYVKQCAPGALFDQFQRACASSADVVCNGRPILDADPYVPSTLPPSTLQPQFQPLPRPLQSITPPPRQNRIINRAPPRVPLPPVRQLTAGINTVPIRLFTESYGPQLTQNECAEIGRLVSRYVRHVSNYYDSNCAADTDCQNSMPVFQTQCLQLARSERSSLG